MSFSEVMGFCLGMPPYILTIPNPGWETGDAGGWTLAHTTYGLCVVAASYPKSGVYALRMESNSIHSAASMAYWLHPNFRAYIGRTIEFSIYERQVPILGTGADRYIKIDDGVANTQANFVLGGQTYTKTTVQHTVSANATMLQFYIRASKIGGGPTYGWRIDDMAAKIVE